MLENKRKLGDFSEEIEAHLQLEAERLRHEGLSEKEAYAAARRSFGNVMHAEERFYESGGWLWWDHFCQDVRYGFCVLLREKRVTALCVFILALGIGASTALYSVWKSALVFPYEFQSNGRWVAILASFNRQQTRSWFFSLAEYHELRQLSDVFENFTILQHVMVNLTDNGHPETLDVTAACADAIQNTGIHPILGRAFLPGEDAPGGPNVVIIAYDLWHTRYQARPDILGQQIRMNEQNYSIIGVMPPYYRLWGTELWIPLRLDQNDRDRSHRAYWVTAMIKKGVSQQQANARLSVLAQQWQQQSGGTTPEYAGLRLWTEVVMRYVTSSMRDAMLVLLAAIALLLLITCANVTNILLARVTARRREVAIRLAVGGSRARIICQFLAESLLMALASGALGLLLALAGLPLIRAHVIDYVTTEAPEFRFDFRAFLLIAAFSSFIGLLYGIVPALQASRTSLTETLKEGGRAGASLRSQWWRKGLVVAQIGLALVVLASASLMVQSYSRLSNSSVGFNPDNVLQAIITLPERAYQGTQQSLSFSEDLQRSISAVPRVDAAGIVSSLPMVDRLDRQDFHVEGRAANSGDSMGGAAVRFATPGYFSAMRISLAAGRFLADDDHVGGQLVAVVNETLAKRFWPNESAIGKHIALGTSYSEHITVAAPAPNSTIAAPLWLAIVGVIHDTRQVQEWSVATLPEIYLPLAQSTAPLRSVRIVIRSSESPAELLTGVREAISRLDSSLPLGGVSTMREEVRDAYATERLALVLLAIFAIIALLLAVAGVYALFSYDVSQRFHEIGVRMALGAGPRDILTFILRSGVRLALLGIAVGVVAALFLARLMTRLLYQLDSRDPLIFSGAALALLACAILACHIPARRATHIDPLVSLRCE